MTDGTGGPTGGRPVRSHRVEFLFDSSPLEGQVRSFELWGPGDEKSLTSEEAAVVASAVEGRRTQYAAGRQCAHQALELLESSVATADHGNWAGQPILPDGKRAPRWPEGVLGSISHTDGYAVAAVTPGTDHGRSSTLGIDAEQLGRVTDELHDRLFLPAERERLDKLDAVARDAASTLMFGAKEAFYKAQYPVTEAWVGFHDVELLPDPNDTQRFVLHPATGLEALGRFVWPLAARGVVHDGIAVTVVVAVRA